MVGGSLGCPSCGAVVGRAADAPAAVCPFCTSTLVPAAQGTGAPPQVVPFSLDEREVLRRVRKWLSAQLLAPSAVQRAPVTSARAAFVPFHVFDGVVRSTFSGRLGIGYTTGSRKRRRHHVDWFPDQRGSLVRRASDHLVSASRGLSEATANALEPFDLGAAVAWDPVFAAVADVEEASVGAAEAGPIAQRELERLGREGIARVLAPFRAEVTQSHEVTFELRGLVALPVWMVRLAGPAGPVVLYVNGQTGEVVGQVGTSGWKVALPVVGVAGGAVGLVIAVVAVFALVMLVFGVGVPLLVFAAGVVGELLRGWR